MSQEVTKPLTPGERAELARHKETVSRGLNTFIEVGLALTAIKDKQLYRETHKSLKAFVLEEFGLAERHAQRVMAAAKIVEDLRPNLSTTRPPGRVTDTPSPVLPESESQIRPLADVPEEDRQRAWTLAVNNAKGRQPTAKQVQEAADAIKGSIPERLKPVFEEATTWGPTASMLEKAAPMLKAVEDSALWRRLDGGKDVFNVKLQSTAQAIRAGVPTCPCPECGGVHEPSMDNDPCPKCKDKGFLTKEEAEES